MTKTNNQSNAKGIAAVLEGEDKKVQMKKGLTILPELNDLLDNLSEEEFSELKKSIKAEGIRDPLVVWGEKNAIVDGHNRYRAATLLDIAEKDIPIKKRSFKDAEEAKEWMIRNQLGRRNLTPQRFEYFIGKLYNQSRQDPNEVRKDQGGETTASKIGKQYGVSERSVRRAGDKAKGVDMLERVKGRLAKLDQLSGEKAYTAEELTEIGKQTNPAVATRMVDKLDNAKEKEKQEKAEAKVPAKTPAKTATKTAPPKTPSAPKETTYGVALVEPNFDAIGYSNANQKKPPLDTNAIVYLLVPDEHLPDGINLLDKWGLEFHGSFVVKLTEGYEGIWTKVQHTFLLVGTRGTVTGPKAGKEADSLMVSASKGDVQKSVEKVIGDYHGKAAKLAMVSKMKVPQGWTTLAK